MTLNGRKLGSSAKIVPFDCLYAAANRGLELGFGDASSIANGDDGCDSYERSTEVAGAGITAWPEQAVTRVTADANSTKKTNSEARIRRELCISLSSNMGLTRFVILGSLVQLSLCESRAQTDPHVLGV